MKLTDPQRRALAALNNATDIWIPMEAWKAEGGHPNPACRGGFQKTVEHLHARGLIEWRGDDLKDEHYRITPAGRSVLKQGGAR